MKRSRQKNYKFTKRRHSGPGVLALACSFVPLALFCYAVMRSYQEGGNAQAKIGCIGVAAVLAALLTLRAAVCEARKENVIKKVPVAAAIVSALMLAGWTAVYVLGWIGA